MGRSLQGWVRAGFVRGRLAGLEPVLGAHRAALVERELGLAFVRKARDRAVRLQPVEVEVELIEAVDRLFGRVDMQRWSHDHAVGIARRGAFGAIVNNAVRLFGVSPHGMTRAAVRAWAHTYRDLGRLVHLGSDPEHIVLRWRDPPAWVVEHDAYAASLAAGLTACFTLAQRCGEVERRRVDTELSFSLQCAPLLAAS